LEYLRLVLYPVGLIGAIVMTYEFGKLRQSFGYVLAVVFICWALVAAGLLLMLAELLFSPSGLPRWGSYIFTAVAALIAFMPWAVAGWWARRNGRHGASSG
jgi:hypothetical protein